MFNKPEELIMAVLAGLWVVASYFLAGFTGASAKYVFLITGLTLGWSALSFTVWRADRLSAWWPVLLGLMAACWWPWLDWLVVRGVVPESSNGVIVLNKPWYASWTFKLTVSLLIAAAGYAYKWQRGRRRRNAGLL